MALVDTGCMQSLALRQCCRKWKQKEAHVLTVGGSTLKSCGVGIVELSLGTMLPIAMKVLIVDRELLGFDLLLGLEAIKLLGGITLTSIGEVKFPQCEKPPCAAITINEPDSCASVPVAVSEIKGQRFCLTRLGFGLNIASLIMRSIVHAVMKQDKIINATTSSYIDDIFVDESMCSTYHVKKHLGQFGLTSKIPEQFRHGTCMLGL